MTKARYLMHFVALVAVTASDYQAQGGLTGTLRIHDPSRIMKDADQYYIFYTGNGISTKRSDDLVNWSNGTRVFNSPPAWTQTEVPSNNGSFWAPDIIKHNGEYRLYYSVSSFGSNDSAIGLATNVTLDPMRADYAWIDQGVVIDSETNSSFNAIDPSVFVDNLTGRMWMTFGSFWNGVFIAELDPATGKPFTGSPSVVNLARSPVNPPNEIEGSFLYERGGFYYLFVNWGNCCQGTNSTYQIRVGRSTSPTGPFVSDGRGNPPMVNGNGRLFLGSEGDYIGPGHIGIYSHGNAELFGYHYYNPNDGGRGTLNLRYLEWTTDGWPIPGAVVPEPALPALLIICATFLTGHGRHMRCRRTQP